VQEFDDLYNKKIAKRYGKYEIRRLLSTKRKSDRKREIGAGRPFKLVVRVRYVILLVYYSSLYYLYFSWLSVWPRPK